MSLFQNEGHCPTCDSDTTFVATATWLRDYYICGRCRSIPRERALMAVIEDYFPRWRELTIHESSPAVRGASARLAEHCRNYVPSQFFPDVPRGQSKRGVRCEDLENLTFADASIDLHVTQDVVEHLLAPARAFREIARTLRPGGAHVFTVPLVNKQRPSELRAKRGAAGEVVHVKAPEYHANPIDPSGSLVAVDWGFDICAHIAAACGLSTHVVVLDDPSRGIRAEYIEVLLTLKPPAPITAF